MCRDIGILENWLAYLNDSEFNLMFAGQMEAVSISFLDVTLSGVDGQVVSRFYRKPFVVNTVLWVDLGYSSHCMKGKPTGQFLGLCHIYSNDNLFNNGAELMWKRFQQ